MAMIVKNNCVDFSMNPIYKQGLFSFEPHQDEALAYLETILSYPHGNDHA